MERTSVDSSNIKGVGFEDGVLEVEFKGGGIYQYADVPEKVFDDFMQASSKGVFFAAHIKKAYEFKKVS